MNFTIGHNRIRINDTIIFQGCRLHCENHFLWHKHVIPDWQSAIMCLCLTEIHMSSQGHRLKRNPALIRNAIQRISKGHSLNSVAKAAGIPEASLRCYNSKPEMIDRPIGPKTLLTDEEELGLATAALWLKERGLPLMPCN